MMTRRSDENNFVLVQHAFEAFLHGDMHTVRDIVASDLEWTFLDPTQLNPSPTTCHGRGEFEAAAKRWAGLGLSSEIEEMDSAGDLVVVIVHAPGLDEFRARTADDRNFHVITVRDKRIVAIRACIDRAEARHIAGIDDTTSFDEDD